jgi:hypothetical protein
MTKGPKPALRSAMNVFLTPASLNVAICSGDRVTPAGGPLMILDVYVYEGSINQ